jgi:uncharacterized membrane protein YkoI
MSARRTWFAPALAVALCAAASAAAEERHCLNKEQQRAAITSGKAMRLGAALKPVKRRGGEVVRARLCEGGKGLVYLLTVLGRDGKVTRLTVDATSGDAVSSIGSGR